MCMTTKMSLIGMKEWSLTGHRSDIMNDCRQRLFCTCNYADACSQPVAAVSSRVSRCRLHMQLDSFEYRYGKRENQVIVSH